MDEELELAFSLRSCCGVIHYVLIGTALIYPLAFLTNLIPSFWNSYSTYWLGPVFTLINASAIAYLIFKK